MAGKHIPMRMCVACREMRPQSELMRFVLDISTDTVLPDMDKKLFGRGAYICKNPACVKLAVKKRGLERHFKRKISQELYDIAYKTADDTVD